MTTIAIIGALDDEVALIAASLNDVTHDRQAGLDVTRGTWEPTTEAPSPPSRPSAAWDWSTPPPPRSI